MFLDQKHDIFDVSWVLKVPFWDTHKCQNRKKPRYGCSIWSVTNLERSSGRFKAMYVQITNTFTAFTSISSKSIKICSNQQHVVFSTNNFHKTWKIQRKFLNEHRNQFKRVYNRFPMFSALVSCFNQVKFTFLKKNHEIFVFFRDPEFPDEMQW